MAKLRILLRAPLNTLFIGKEILHLEQVDSTNTHLKNLLSGPKRLNEGLLVFADTQFAGKGQAGNTWISSPEKNCLLSILFYPTFLMPKHIFYFNKAIALAVHGAVAELLIKNNINPEPLTIKWPNDILYNNNKLAGILIENTLKQNSIENSIVGIGININEVFGDINPMRATSLKNLCKTELNMQEVIDCLCAHLERYYLLLREQNFERIDRQYHSYLYAKDTKKSFIINGEDVAAVVEGVNCDGQIMLKLENEEKFLAPQMVKWKIT